MKTIFLSLALLSSVCFASGKLSLQGSYYDRPGKVTPSFGIAIYEQTFFGVAYNGWTGFGWQPREFEPSVLWLVSRHDLEKWFGKVGVSAGYSYRHADQHGAELQSLSDFHVKIQYKLW